MTIKKLPDSVISRIAAGEVITSPASAIKEMLENSLDANSTLISINLNKNSTNFSIRDNGDGIDKEDLEFLCLNHYTSKLDSLNVFKGTKELLEMSTFGFRGEALHSISICSHLKVTTKKDKNLETGYRAIYNSGAMVELKEVAFEGKGTLFEVTDIFYNSISRSSYFDKNKETLILSLEIIKSYGIIFNSIECKVDGKVMLKLDSSNRNSSESISKMLENRKNYIWQNIVSNSLRKENLLTFHNEKFVIICSDFTVKLRSKKFILFINKRLVRNNNLLIKILEKYKKASNGCNPFIFVEITTDHVDVNVNPSKAEVFIENTNIFDEIVEKIGELLLGTEIYLFMKSKPIDEKVISTNIYDRIESELNNNSRLITNDIKNDKIYDQSSYEDPIESNLYNSSRLIINDIKNDEICHQKADTDKNESNLHNSSQLIINDTISAQNSNEIPIESNLDKSSQLIIDNNDNIQNSFNLSQYSNFDSFISTNSQISKFQDLSFPRSVLNSPFKIYSSPHVRRLEEQFSESTQEKRKFSLRSLKELQSSLKGNDPYFFKNLVFVGAYDGFIFAQHLTNLIKIKKQPFLFQVFYQKFIKDFGNFECLELKIPTPVEISEDLFELLREYFSICIESNCIISCPKVFGIDFQFDFKLFHIEKFDEISTIKQISESLAEIYSNVEIDSKIFNRIKTEVICTAEIIDCLSLLVDLKELYKNFDRC